MVNVNDFKDKSILEKNINITPPDIWDLVMKIDFDDNNHLNHNYFQEEQRIKLDEANDYFKKVLNMVNKLSIEIVEDILDEYKNINLTDKKEKLVNLLLH